MNSQILKANFTLAGFQGVVFANGSVKWATVNCHIDSLGISFLKDKATIALLTIRPNYEPSK